MSDEEAQVSASTKIIITCFYAAPSVWKSQPAAITGAGMNSCLEMPEAVSLSSSAHSLSSAPAKLLQYKEELQPDQQSDKRQTYLQASNSLKSN